MSKNFYSFCKSLLMLIILLVIVLTVGTIDAKESEKEKLIYCDMVETWEKTNGQKGWPPFKGSNYCLQ